MTAMIFPYRELVEVRRDNAQTARDIAWNDFLLTVGTLRVAQDAMDAAHRRFMQAEKELETARAR